MTKEIIAGIRNFRKEKGISFKERIDLNVSNSNSKLAYEASIIKLGFVGEMNYQKPSENSFGGTFRVNNLEFFIPTDAFEDTEPEREKIQTELEYTKGFLASVNKKLSNERFVANAPEKVIAIERKKVSDAEEKISLLKKSLALL